MLMTARKSKKRSSASGVEAAGLVAARIMVGVFFVFEGWEKLPWLTDPSRLASILHRWFDAGSPLGKWYIETVALPGVPIFARLVFLGEVAAGLALIFGVWTQLTALISFLLVLNIHLAHSTLFKYSFLSQGDGLPVLGILLALMIGGARLPLSLKKATVKS
jgi:uncharacterized membrane protein YphA (DoxX/SURF4 family)